MFRFLLAASAVCPVAVKAAEPARAQVVWEQAVQAKGGRERLHQVQSLAIYMKPAPVSLAGPLATWLCAFPDRYFEFTGPARAHVSRAIVVDAGANRIAMDATGMPRRQASLGGPQRERLMLNQILFLLDSNWLHPEPVEVRGRVLTVQAGERTFQLSLNSAHLPERIRSSLVPGQAIQTKYDYRMQNYRAFAGILLPTRVSETSASGEAVWDVDYEVDAKYNPALFQRMPDLAAGPEPWH
jgi:hypothetical protein